eukprot:CAMPEP_0118697632 /NCGR_PEP_ID=MMETSP0800-20121206/14650_1 /TAXON_ID=210618 ORGANISM="Striatella unipunctata, Strain CCMP2910" /NCGR_SAMPLE_ID=MMETSP0800 /ASSEMBLY_ACC=CAM_ASM_000638 /LENGTH=122 /DNA_ID=CAMNT_0006597157 /DNA_START=92 /DNA_END=460 /DNA_ORIENTATION=+
MAPNLKHLSNIIDILPSDALATVQSKYPTLDSHQPHPSPTTTSNNDPSSITINPVYDNYWQIPSESSKMTISNVQPQNDTYWDDHSRNTKSTAIVINTESNNDMWEWKVDEMRGVDEYWNMQ